MKYISTTLFNMCLCYSLQSMELIPEVKKDVQKKSNTNHLANLVLFSVFNRGSFRMSLLNENEHLKNIVSNQLSKPVSDYPIQKEVSSKDSLTLLLHPRMQAAGGGYDYAIIDTTTWYKDGWVSALDINPYNNSQMVYALLGANIHVDDTHVKSNKGVRKFIFSAVASKDEKRIQKRKQMEMPIVRSLVYDPVHNNKLFCAIEGFKYISVHDLENNGCTIKKIPFNHDVPVQYMTAIVTAVNTELLLFIDEHKNVSAIIPSTGKLLGSIYLAGLKDRRAVIMSTPEKHNKIIIWHPEGYHTFLFKF